MRAVEVAPVCVRCAPLTRRPVCRAWRGVGRCACLLRCVAPGPVCADWSAYDMVYLFQRPESMPRAVHKAAELRPGAWLVSLEFEALALQPTASYTAPGGKTVWMYRAPLQTRAV